MKHFNNVINSSILKEDEEKLVIENVPIPELHLYLNHITNISRMITTNIHIDRWFKDKHIHFHGYNGGGLDDLSVERLFLNLVNSNHSYSANICIIIWC